MSKIELDKDLIVIGNIVGEHTITDINVTIRYKEAVRLSPKQVSSSKDLFRDIKAKKILVDPRLYSHSKPKKRNVKESDSSFIAKKSFIKESPKKNPSVTPSSSKTSSSPDIEALKFITAGNARSLEELSQMIGLVLMELKNLKSEPKNNSLDPNILRELLKQIQVPESRFDTEPISNTPTFIPSDLFVGDENIVNTNLKIKSEKHESGRLDDSLAALKKMREK